MTNEQILKKAKKRIGKRKIQTFNDLLKNKKLYKEVLDISMILEEK